MYIEGGELIQPEADEEQIRDEEAYLDEETPENDVKKYYVSDGQGLIWSEDEAFEMKNSTEKIQRDDIIYELENVFYQNGEWEIHLIITCTDKQKTTITNKSEEQIKNEESWINEEITYLNQAYLLLKGTEKHYLSEYEYRWIKGSEYTVRDKYRVSMKTTGIYENTDVCIVLPDGKKIEIVMDKIASKDYIENDEQGLKVGVAERINGQLILSLHSEQTEEYQIAARITQDYFDPLVTENKLLSLLDENGNSCSPNRINTKDLDGEKIYEVYFPEKDPGNYTLHIPYLCVLKNMKTETVEIPLPTGEDTEILCEVPVTFPDGTGFVIQRVIRYEETGYVYHVIEDQLVIEEVKTWMYELKYNTEEDGEMIFNVAKVAGTTSENDGVHAAIRVVDNETKYILETNSDKIASSVSVEFYEPLYLWNKEMFLDVLIN